MDESSFHELADECLERFEEALEEADADGKLDVELLEGILTIGIEDKGEFVINKHVPSLQLWVSSPLTGAAYFGYDDAEGDWIEEGGESSLFDFLAGELDQAAEVVIET